MKPMDMPISSRTRWRRQWRSPAALSCTVRANCQVLSRSRSGGSVLRMATPVIDSELAARLARVARKSHVTLTHYGRKSGKPYQVTIWFTVDGDHVNLHTMSMQRQWPRNVLANGRVTLRIGDETFEGTATPV